MSYWIRTVKNLDFLKLPWRPILSDDTMTGLHIVMMLTCFSPMPLVQTLFIPERQKNKQHKNIPIWSTWSCSMVTQTYTMNYCLKQSILIYSDVKSHQTLMSVFLQHFKIKVSMRSTTQFKPQKHVTVIGNPTYGKVKDVACIYVKQTNEPDNPNRQPMSVISLPWSKSNILLD